jgi:hypothetical protein
LELQLNRKFVKRHKIDEIFDFHKLAVNLPGHHIFFGKFEERTVRKQLKKCGKWARTDSPNNGTYV